MHYLEYIYQNHSKSLFLYTDVLAPPPEILNQYTRDETQAYARTSVVCKNFKKGAV